MKHPRLKNSTAQILQALAAMCMVAPLIAHAQQATDLGNVSANGGGDSSESAAAKPTASKTGNSRPRCKSWPVWAPATLPAWPGNCSTAARTRSTMIR